MKKIVLICMGAVLLIGFVIGFVWWHLPTVFLEDVDPADVVRIEVFNGTSGVRFSIENSADISHIVTNIQRMQMYREEWEIADGFVYSLSFYAANGSRIAQFELNDDDSIRNGNMEYECEQDTLCFGYIRELEENK